MVFAVLDSARQTIDNLFKVAGAIPLLNLAVGPLQIVYGKIEIVVGAGSFFAHYGSSLIQRDPLVARKLEAKAIKSLEIVAHGILDIIRGIAVYFFLGIPLLLFYDLPGFQILKSRKVEYYERYIPEPGRGT